MRGKQVQFGANRNDPSGVDLLMRHVVMTLDMLEIDRFCYSRLLIKVQEITLQIWIIHNPSNVALEMPVINGVKPNESAEKPTIRFDHSLAKKITTASEPKFQFVQS